MRHLPAARGERAALALLVVLVLAGTGLRAAVIGGNRRISRDEQGYVADANRLLGPGQYNSFKWAPGTPLVFGVATRLAGKRTLVAERGSRGPAQVAQLVLELLTLVLIAGVAWRSAGALAALLAVALTATYIPLVLVTRTYFSEPLGGLTLLVLLAAAAAARGRGLRWVAAAGVVAGAACLCRNDWAPAVAVVAAALALGHPGPLRHRLGRAALYAGCALAVMAPWVAYASAINGRFVPVTTSGPTALFIGTYLPGRGEQFRTERAFAPEVCHTFPELCHLYPAYGSKPMFFLLKRRYHAPDVTSAATQASLHNLRVYAVGRPGAFTAMLGRKAWRMWGGPWGGGNLRSPRSPVQHAAWVLLALTGLLGGAWRTRRWDLLTAAAVVALITALNVVMVSYARNNLRVIPTLLTYGSIGLVELARTASRARAAPG